MSNIGRRLVALFLCLSLLLRNASGAALKLFIDLDAKAPEEALVESFYSRNSASGIIYTRDDLRSVELHFLEEDDNDPQRPFRYVDPASWNAVKFAAGTPDLAPLEGTFTVTGPGGGTTSALAYNISAASLQTALRGLTNLSLCIVTGPNGGPWEVDATAAAGSFTEDPTITATGLGPTGSTGYVIDTQEGNGTSLGEKWILGLTRAHPILRTTGWSALPSASVAVTTVQTGSASANEVYRVRYNADAYAGAVVLAFTGDTTTGTVTWRFDASSDEVVTAFEAHTDVEDDGVAVVKSGPGDYTIELVGAGIRASATPALATASNTLQVPVGLTASLSSNTALVSTLLGSANTVAVTTEVEISRNSGEPETVAQVESTLSRDLIRNTPGQSTGLEMWAKTSDIPKVSGDTSDLPSLDPDFEGQLLLLRDEQLNLYRANGTSPGDWTSSFGVATLLTQNFATSGVRAGIAAKTGDYTATSTDFALIFNVATSKTVALPAASSNTGRIYFIKVKATSPDTVTIDPNGAELIEGSATLGLTIGQGVMIICDGTGWHQMTSF